MHFVYLINKITFKEKSEKFYTEKFCIKLNLKSRHNLSICQIHAEFITLIMNLIMNLFTFLLFMIVKER